MSVFFHCEQFIVNRLWLGQVSISTHIVSSQSIITYLFALFQTATFSSTISVKAFCFRTMNPFSVLLKWQISRMFYLVILISKLVADPEFQNGRVKKQLVFWKGWRRDRKLIPSWLENSLLSLRFHKSFTRKQFA